MNSILGWVGNDVGKRCLQAFFPFPAQVLFFFLIKALKALVWHLSRKPLYGIGNLRKKNNLLRTSQDEQAIGQTSSATN